MTPTEVACCVKVQVTWGWWLCFSVAGETSGSLQSKESSIETHAGKSGMCLYSKIDFGTRACLQTALWVDLNRFGVEHG